MSEEQANRMEWIENYCRDNDLIAVVPTQRNILLLDIDYASYYVVPPDAEDLPFNIRGYCVLPSRSGNGLHVYMEIDAMLDPEKACAAQAKLGSDPQREKMSLLRIRNDEPYPVLLFEKPGFMEELPSSYRTMVRALEF